MSSPTPSHDGGDASKNNQEQITFRFCSECSNMLYPKEDEDAHKLMFTCRTCQYTEEATSSCVYRNVMNNAAGETAGVTQDVGSDPTVRSQVSSNHPSLRASTSTPTPASADNSLAVCLRCGVTLLHCNRCKDPASVEEYNHFVAHNPDYAFTRTLDSIQFATCWNAQDDEEKAAWAEKFASCGELTASDLVQDSLSSILFMDNPLMSLDADPPEALEEPPEYDDICPSYDGSSTPFGTVVAAEEAAVYV